jgi:hypothetical protein
VADRGTFPRYRGQRGKKYPGQTKNSPAALRFAEGPIRARGRKPRRQITLSSRLGVVQRASYPSTEKEYKLKNLNVYDLDGLKGTDNGEDNTGHSSNEH